MDQDDPEKRVADLERQLGEQHVSDLPPAQPPQPQPANAAPETGNGSRMAARTSSLATGVWMGIFLVAFGVGGLAYVAYYSYGYWVGTPATATVDHCESGGLLGGWGQGSSTYCNGTWSVGGQSQNGPIRPPFWSGESYKGPGSSLDVHASDSTAYRLGKYLYVWIVGPILVVWGSANLWRKWRGRNRG